MRHGEGLLTTRPGHSLRGSRSPFDATEPVPQGIGKRQVWRQLLSTAERILGQRVACDREGPSRKLVRARSTLGVAGER